MITQEHIDKAISYAQYRDMIGALLMEGKTTGDDHSETMVNYTKLNMQRMHRIEKQFALIPEFSNELKKPRPKEIWLVISEAWCGDAAQCVTPLQHIAQGSPDISLKILLRDENLDVMDLYLTHGSRSIPKLISLDAETLEEKWTWGPRPAPAQNLMMTLKNDDSLSPIQRAEKLHGWYAKDKTLTLQNEIWQLMGKRVSGE